MLIQKGWKQVQYLYRTGRTHSLEGEHTHIHTILQGQKQIQETKV